jgi:hypothetical protein
MLKTIIGREVLEYLKSAKFLIGLGIALALADVFKVGVNELPLTLVLSWYEQKAVCVLLALLHLGRPAGERTCTLPLRVKVLSKN